MAFKHVRISGLAEVEKVLRALPRAVAQSEIEKALAFGAIPIRDEAKRLVQKRSGELRDAIRISRTKRGPRRRVRRGGVIFLGFSQPASRRAHLTEFGTRHSRAFPFMRPALATKFGAFLARFGDRLGKNIEKTALSLAGRFGAIRKSVRRRL